MILPQIEFQEFTLPNGLRVILHEDHSTPIVAVNIWYHVGSKNEAPGRTGFAHLFEHLMFQGSKHHDDDYFKPLQAAGGTLNGSTNYDRTNYWEVVPSNFLELALWLEADRMGYLLEAMTEEKLANQRDVVKNEKRQNYDNRPYGLVPARIAELMYPPDHPYHWLTIGSLEDITAASLDDVKEFFRRFYTPNNASLVIAGDFQPAAARRLVEKYFGAIKRGPRIAPVRAPQPRLEKEIRLQTEDRVTLPRIYLVWHAVPQWSEHDAALDMLAGLLTGTKGSRLYRSLVYEKQIAQDVSAFNASREIAGQFQIVATARAGRTLAEIEALIDEEIARIKAAPPGDAEIERVYNAIEASFVYSLQAVGGFGGRSDQLNQYAVFRRDPGYFQQDLERYRRVTAQDIQRVAAAYLTDRRLALSVVPRGPEERAKSAAPVPEGPTKAGVSPSRQTAEPLTAPVSATPETAPTGAARVATSEQRNDERPAGVQPQTRAEADATLPAGAAPPAASAPLSHKERAPEPPPHDGLYVMPAPGPTPPFRLPEIERRRLSNGLEVLIVEHHDLPVVNMNLVIRTGAAADPAGRAGLAEITAAMIDEGTKRRTALDISNGLAEIGARLGTGAGWDGSGVNLLTVTRHLDRALEIYADVITSPAYLPAELERIRASRLTLLAQRRDSANEIASVVYAALLYGRDHPYGHPLTGHEQSLRAIAPDDLRSFYATYYRPNNAALIVAGDVSPDAVVDRLEQALAGWLPASVPPLVIPAAPARDQARIYLVDRPASAQSVIAIGQVGPPRSTPDYFPLLVMNTLLGGQFTSRLNMNLREDKGYTYGARTSFDYRRGAGPFIATASVQTAVTKEAVAEFLKELVGIRGAVPVTQEELEFAKQSIIRGFPRGFETSSQIADRLSDVVLYDLPDNYFNDYIWRVSAVTLDDVVRVAEKHLDPSRMVILVVGDRRLIEDPLRSLDGLGSTVTALDAEGRPKE